MSRRVFDVGLDMGRIKNGLKLNKDARRAKTARSATNSYTDDSPFLNQQVAVIPKLQNKRSTPNVRALDFDDHEPTSSSEPVVLPSARSPDRVMHGGFPRPPSHQSSPVNEEPSTQDAPVSQRHSGGDADLNFDLRPPPPNKPVKFLDTLSEQLFSGDHLNVILGDPSLFLRFTAFLNRYRPHSAPVLVRYLEQHKAMKAVEYANALAQTIRSIPGDPLDQTPCPAASIDPMFEARAKKAFTALVTEALPAYITHALVKVVTESMVKEITGTTMPVMRELVGGLAEVFCLSDPSLKDNPIVYASEEFYRTTQYGRDYAIGRNCRFLQGPKTDRRCVSRLGAALKAGQEFSEVILNYRRDGSPFMNLLLTAPLYDNRGTIRYFIGAQVDVSGLIEEGRGLDSFARCLEELSQQRQRENDLAVESASKRSLRTLEELGQMLSVDESAVFQPRSRSSSMQDTASSVNHAARGNPRRRETGSRPARRVIGRDEGDDEEERGAWEFASAGPSGKLPGVYQNYLLVRPYPSLRIIFVSSGLRIPGLLQSPFLSRIGGPPHVRDSLSDAFEAGAAVTAKVLWLPQGRSASDDNQDRNQPQKHGTEPQDPSRPSSRRGPSQTHNPYGMNGDSNASRTRYISCTPLLGSDDQVGVWMVVMVENEQVTGGLASRDLALRRFGDVPSTPSEYEREDHTSGKGWAGWGKPAMNGHPNGDGAKMYAEFLRSHQGQGRKDRGEENGDRERAGVMEGMLDGLGDGGGVPSGRARLHDDAAQRL